MLKKYGIHGNIEKGTANRYGSDVIIRVTRLINGAGV
jgi:hypothetical protein